MSRTPEQIAHARYVRRAATAKIRAAGHDFGGRVTDALVCAQIQRMTGEPLPGRGSVIAYMQKFVQAPVGEPVPSRQHDALNAPAYRLDRVLRALAAEAAKVQRPLVHAVSRVDNWRTLGEIEA
ncbi:MAG: hypothetical protein ACN6PJ_29730 [Achromobacter sp.]|uniref:hypothetical protein n=1 Tax=Achromobacter sp. TaxID=134375 RepID=UPI003D06B2CD